MTNEMKELLATVYVAGFQHGYSMSFSDWLENDPNAGNIIAGILNAGSPKLVKP